MKPDEIRNRIADVTGLVDDIYATPFYRMTDEQRVQVRVMLLNARRELVNARKLLETL